MNAYKTVRLATQKYHNLIGNNLIVNNGVLFTEAHKMTKLSIKPTETYRYKFGQWLVFLKIAMTNKLGTTSINQSVCYVPILDHDRIGYNSLVRTSYSFKPPMTICKTYYGTIGNSVQSWHINKYVTSYIKNNTFLLCLLAMQLIFIVLIFTAKF